MTELTPAEPSMDEILASIRRIISEDMASVGPVGPADSAPAGEHEDVLLLTERAPAEPSPFADPPSPEPVRAAPEPAPAPAAAPEPSREVAVVSAADSGAVSRETAVSVGASLDRLSFAVERPASALAVAPGGATLEDLTRELLKPVLKAWLDENLAGIVKARVDEEVERIVRGRVG